MRLPNGEFRPYTHSLGTTIHGEQYMAPWHIPGRGNYVVDDFGDTHLHAGHMEQVTQHHDH